MFTRDQAKNLLKLVPIIEAFANGEEDEVEPHILWREDDDDDGEWEGDR